MSRGPSGSIIVQELDARGEPVGRPSRFVDGAWRAALRHARYIRRHGGWVRLTADNRRSRVTTWFPLPSTFVVMKDGEYLQWRMMGNVVWGPRLGMAAAFDTWRAARKRAAEVGGKAVAA